MLVKFLKAQALDDAPWTWKSSWNSDMPAFFQVIRRILAVNIIPSRKAHSPWGAACHCADCVPMSAGHAQRRHGQHLRHARRQPRGECNFDCLDFLYAGSRCEAESCAPVQKPLTLVAAGVSHHRAGRSHLISERVHRRCDRHLLSQRTRFATVTSAPTHCARRLSGAEAEVVHTCVFAQTRVSR